MRNKVLIISPHYNEFESVINPIESLHREILVADTIRALGYEVKLFVLAKEKIDEEYIQSFQPITAGSRASTDVVSPELSAAVKTFNPKVIVIKGAGYRISTDVWRSIKGRAKIIFILGGGTYDFLFPIAQYIFKEYPNQMLSINLFGALTRRSHYLPKRTLASYETVRSTSKEIDIIAVGRLIKVKNLTALASLSRVFKVAIVGDGPERLTLESLITRDQLNLTLLGQLSQSETARVIARSRIMVHPSLSEGLPRVFLEAFSMGVPVVALKETFSSAHLGTPALRLVSIANLHDEVTTLLNDEIQMKSLSIAALIYANKQKNEFTLALQKFKEVIIDALDGRADCIIKFLLKLLACHVCNLSYRINKKVPKKY